MTETMDIVIKDCRLRGRGEQSFDIGIRAGRIEAILEQLPDAASVTIDAQGKLVTESFVNPHLHLDKVFTLAMLDDAAMADYQEEGMGKRP